VTFFSALEDRVRSTGSALCVGLDPRAATAVDARDRCRALIEATAGVAAAFKPNAAFFEALGPPGIEALVEVVAAVPEEIPVILDAKRGDIASSAAAYAAACFDVIGAGAVTLSPYLGADALAPFLEREDRGVWILAHTSNPGAAAIQGVVTDDGRTIAERVAAAAITWAGPDRLGLVVGATRPGALEAIRAIAPSHWILAPGVGAQGAEPDAIAPGLRDDGRGVLVPVSRAIADAADPASAARDLHDAIAAVRPGPRRVAGVAADLVEAGSVRFGEFTLRSGTVSPVYLDLRRLSGFPAVLRRCAGRYAELLGGLAYDHVGAVPYGAIAIATAVALRTGSSLVWPRPQAKDHGTGATVEGAWRPGERVVLIDDVATSGQSAIEAAGLLREAGLSVGDLVVLVERDPAARSALDAAGIRLHAVTTLDAIVDDLEGSGALEAGVAARVRSLLGR
jgi:uridine monophosphate synthetase